MRFLAFSPLAAYALLASVGALILLLYLLKPRARQVVVSSMLLWKRVTGLRRPGATRWRWLRSLLLALGAGLAIALSLTRPELPALGGVTERIVVLLDNSPSMAARTADGKSRWRHAVEQASAVVRQTGTGSEILVMDTMGSASLAGFVSREAALASLGRLSVGTFGTPRIPPVPADVGVMQTHLFTDGVALPDAPARVRVHSSFESVDNVAVTAFETRPLVNDPTRYQAFVQVFNASRGAHRVQLVIEGEPQYKLLREVEVPAGETVEEIFDISAFDSGILRVQALTEGDGFDLDDVAYSIVAPHRPRRVMLITAGDPFLVDSIQSLPGVRMTIHAPSDYRPGPGYDAYVFDRFAPDHVPPAGALLFLPPAKSWLTPMAAEIGPVSITGWDETSPLTTGVAWNDIQAKRAELMDLRTGIVFAKGRREAALVTAVSEPLRRIQVGFALNDSNFYLQPGFPVFLGNALSWLTTRTGVIERDLGVIQVPLVNAEVRAGDGSRLVTTHTTAGTVFQAARPGVYSVTGAGGEMQVVANILDPNLARINRSRFVQREADSTSALSPARHWWIEPRLVLLWLGGLLLVLEWASFSQRITV